MSDMKDMKDTPRTEAEWRDKLTSEQYQVLRKSGTERAFTGEYWDSKTAGTYRCAGCGEELFSSDTKYESRSGWPSFYAPLNSEMIDEESDKPVNGDPLLDVSFVPSDEVSTVGIEVAKREGQVGNAFQPVGEDLDDANPRRYPDSRVLVSYPYARLSFCLQSMPG